MRDSIDTPLPTVDRNTFGSEERGGAIVAQGREALGAIVLIAGLKRQAGAHQTMNAGSTEGRNQAPIEFGNPAATFGQDLPPPTPPAQSLGRLKQGRARGMVTVARGRHASSHEPRAERRCN